MWAIFKEFLPHICFHPLRVHLLQFMIWSFQLVQISQTAMPYRKCQTFLTFLNAWRQILNNKTLLPSQSVPKALSLKIHRPTCTQPEWPTYTLGSRANPEFEKFVFFATKITSSLNWCMKWLLNSPLCPMYVDAIWFLFHDPPISTY